MTAAHSVEAQNIKPLSEIARNVELASIATLPGGYVPRAYGLRPLIHGRVEIEGAAPPVDYTLAMPGDAAAETIALGINGFGAVKRTSRNFRNDLAANEGIPTISYEPRRTYDSLTATIRGALRPQQIHVNTIDAIAADIESRRDVPKAVRRLAVNAPYTLIPHSMGELSAADWLEDIENADKTALVVHLGAIGLFPSSPAKIARRSLDVALKDIGPGLLRGDFGRDLALLSRSMRHLLSNPLQTGAEIASCFVADVTKSVERLASTSVQQAVVAMESDHFFYPHEQREFIGHLVNRFEIIEGTHTAPQRRSAHVARTVGRIIRELV